MADGEHHTGDVLCLRSAKVQALAASDSLDNLSLVTWPFCCALLHATICLVVLLTCVQLSHAACICAQLLNATCLCMQACCTALHLACCLPAVCRNVLEARQPCDGGGA